LLGATVVIAGRDVAKCEQGARRMQAELSSTSSTGSSSTVGTIVVGPSTDIRNPEQVEALVAFCVQQQGSLDILVNNAVRLSPRTSKTYHPREAKSYPIFLFTFNRVDSLSHRRRPFRSEASQQSLRPT
jgi:NAD(P)-dependent dehydrogenase (short-subunit alcohol dehydrogenase family)